MSGPNVRAKRATTAGRQTRAGDNVPRTAGSGGVACRWRSAYARDQARLCAATRDSIEDGERGAKTDQFLREKVIAHTG